MTSQTLQDRLETLRAEYEKGQRQLDLIEHQRQEIRDTLLRISGAIQVLEELQQPVVAVPQPAQNGNGVPVP